MIEIENAVPIPTSSGATKHKEMYKVFDQMEIQQSFVVDDMKKIISLRMYAKKHNKRILYRKLKPVNYRVWRVG